MSKTMDKPNKVKAKLAFVSIIIDVREAESNCFFFNYRKRGDKNEYRKSKT